MNMTTRPTTPCPSLGWLTGDERVQHLNGDVLRNQQRQVKVPQSSDLLLIVVDLCNCYSKDILVEDIMKIFFHLELEHYGHHRSVCFTRARADVIENGREASMTGNSNYEESEASMESASL